MLIIFYIRRVIDLYFPSMSQDKEDEAYRDNSLATIDKTLYNNNLI